MCPNKVTHLHRLDVGIPLVHLALEMENTHNHADGKSSHHLEEELLRKDIIYGMVSGNLGDLPCPEVLQGIMLYLKFGTSTYRSALIRDGALGGPLASDLLRNLQDLTDRDSVSHDLALRRPRLIRLNHAADELGNILGICPDDRIVAGARDRCYMGIDIHKGRFGEHVRLAVRHAEVVHKVPVVDQGVFEVRMFLELGNGLVLEAFPWEGKVPKESMTVDVLFARSRCLGCGILIILIHVHPPFAGDEPLDGPST